MKNKFYPELLVILFCLIFGETFIASTPISEIENEYSLKNIPKNLRSNANAVIRKDHTTFEVFDDFRAVKKVTYAVTIFKRYENHYGELVLYYDDNLIEIDELEGKLYDQDGQEIRELEDSDIEDYSAYKGYTLFDENRVKLINLYYDKYPYTVEFYYEVEYNGYINLPSWHSQSTPDPVQSNKFEIVFNNNEELRFWANADSIKPEIIDNGDTKSYIWQVNNVPKMSTNQEKSDLFDLTTLVKTAPKYFEIEGNAGSMKTWKEFGSWFFKLYDGKLELTPEAQAEIKKIAENAKDDSSKVKILYKYLQNKVRYVSVQLGIGGWQPFDAKYVHDREYGDCKALSNYMIALLNVHNIKAYPVLINSGHSRKPFIEEFPSNQFNHVIVCVPFEKDTVWLECTSQIRDFGSIGWRNENRKALLIKPDGGEVVNMPKSNFAKNTLSKTIETNISADVAEVNSTIFFEGEAFNKVNYIFNEQGLEEEEKWIKNQLTVPKVILREYSFENLEGEKAILTSNLSLPRYATYSGNRIFFNPNLMERNFYVPDENEERVSPIRFYYPYRDVDTVLYKIPSNYKIESMPENVKIQTSFGEFITTLNYTSENQIEYTRKLEIKNYIIPAENYNEYRDFYSKIAEVDRRQIVLRK